MLSVSYISIGDIKPADRNARTHSPEQIRQIQRSIGEFGWTNPILVDEAGVIIAGHGRLEAAKLAGLASVPTITLTGLSGPQKRALALADNKLALNAGWSDEILRLELGELGLDGFDLSMIGFSPDELAALFVDKTVGLTDPDDVPDAPEPVTVLGDVWVLGRHRIMCGDSTNKDHVLKLMDGNEADLCFTSPPYGQQRDYKASIGDWDTLMQGLFGILPVKHEAQVLVNLGMIHRGGEWLPYWDGWVEWMRAVGWRRFGWYVWDQGPGLPGDWNGRLAPSHEFVFHFNRVAERARKTHESKMSGQAVGGKGLRSVDGVIHRKTNEGGVYQARKIPDDVIRVMRHKGGIGAAGSHPAVFPVDLVSEMLTAFSDPDDIVYEPFCGSGTQLISAQKNGRSAYGMEIAPAYVDIAITRWQNFTGQVATHAVTGEPFGVKAAA
jgi:DNA modification methylase